MIRKGACGRADLADVLAGLADIDEAAELAVFLGDERMGYYLETEDIVDEQDSGEQEERKGTSGTVIQEQNAKLEFVEESIPDVPFWFPWEYHPLSVENNKKTEVRAVSSLSSAKWRNRPKEPPRYHPLLFWRELHPRLRRYLTELRSGNSIDVDLAVGKLSRGRMLEHLPRSRKHRWGPHLQLIEDRSVRLIPIWEDQNYLRTSLRHTLPAEILSRAVCREECRLYYPVERSGKRQQYQMPFKGSVVLVLGDLGLLEGENSRKTQWWFEFGRSVCASGSRPLVLFPLPDERMTEELAAVWEVVPWFRMIASVGKDEAVKRAERLLRLISSAVRIEPGLLRDVRRLLKNEADVSTELDVWNSSAFSARSSIGATLSPDRSRELRRKLFRQETGNIRQQVIATIRTWRGYLPEEIWYEELFFMDKESLAVVPFEDKEDARQYFLDLYWQIKEKGGKISLSDAQWLRRIEKRAEDHLWNDPVIGVPLMKLVYGLRRHEPDYQPPAAFDPSIIEGDENGDETAKKIKAVQVGSEIHFLSQEHIVESGSTLAIFSTREAIKCQAYSFWESGEPPFWAKEWGQDEYGLRVDFEYRGVTQRMRWIPAGSFEMGSPSDESGRWEDEGPQHTVRLTEGFWMFDTPVTRKLWMKVMSDYANYADESSSSNPSRFVHPDRPMENVNWDVCQQFLERLNKAMPGLDLTLPSEAQWEYACRAGSRTALYSGPRDIVGENNAPALDAIAWYGGNSGVEFELKNGHDSSGRSEKQYDHKKAGTHPVKQKKPNAWGLYDMLGNVWELCQDGQREYVTGEVVDPLGPLGVYVERVIRGGSWNDSARGCRCASRGWSGPVYRHSPDSPLSHGVRFDDIGFRCARVQENRLGKQVSAAASGRPAEPDRIQTTASLKQRLWVHGRKDDEQFVIPPDAHTLLLRSDREQITLRRSVLPPWAQAMGRDRFGLWAEFVYKEVRQRLRWIPPGRFTMGSPKDEPGHFDKEGPQRLVTLQRGFWMFDTPVTQELWMAVMSDETNQKTGWWKIGGKKTESVNPSRFQSPDRPVEQISWDDCQLFIRLINEKNPGLALTLPSEAQWEYACRAGSETALYSGQIDIVGENNAPALDAIAWYGGNSGKEFELKNGYDNSDWREKQYDHKNAGTHPVKQKKPNDWGLYDMLGNVWEWVEDVWHKNYEGVPDNGEAWVSGEAGVERVIRGGSWDGYARDCRCAARIAYLLDDRFDIIGFRCARVLE